MLTTKIKKQLSDVAAAYKSLSDLFTAALANFATKAQLAALAATVPAQASAPAALGFASADKTSAMSFGSASWVDTGFAVQLTIGTAGARVAVLFRGFASGIPLTGDAVIGLSIDSGVTVYPIAHFGVGGLLGTSLNGAFIFTGVGAGACNVKLYARSTNAVAAILAGDANRPARLTANELRQ